MARKMLRNCLMTLGSVVLLVLPVSAWAGDVGSARKSTLPGIELAHRFIGAGDSHSLAVTCEGDVYAWGNNGDCQLGQGYGSQMIDIPALVYGPPGVVEVVGGGCHSLSLMSVGHVYAWGCNYHGQLGTQSEYEECAAIQVHGPGDLSFLTGITKLAAGLNHSLAVKEDGSLWSWGAGEHGQLGIGSSDDRTIPYQVHGSDDVGYLTDVVDVAAGDQHSLAVKSDGTVYAWGGNGHGQLGIGTNDDHTIPYQVHGPDNVGYLTGIIKVAAGANFSLALRNDGTMWAWGENYYGQLGIHSNNDHTVPYQVHGADDVDYLTDVVDIAAGDRHTLAVTSDHAVYAWGDNGHGQLGIGTNDNHTVPYQVHGADNVGYLTGIIEVDAGKYFSLTLRYDGTVWAWGEGGDGQLGIHSNNDHTVPYQVHGPDNVGFLTGIGPICRTPPPGAPTPGGAETAICHRPGMPHEKTLYVPWRALKGHLNHGDTLGACSP